MSGFAEDYTPDAEGSRRIFDSASGDWIKAHVYSRAALHPGARVSGPAILVEDETTTLVTNGFSAVVNGLGQIILAKVEVTE